MHYKTPSGWEYENYKQFSGPPGKWNLGKYFKGQTKPKKGENGVPNQVYWGMVAEHCRNNKCSREIAIAAVDELIIIQQQEAERNMSSFERRVLKLMKKRNLPKHKAEKIVSKSIKREKKAAWKKKKRRDGAKNNNQNNQ